MIINKLLYIFGFAKQIQMLRQSLNDRVGVYSTPTEFLMTTSQKTH